MIDRPFLLMNLLQRLDITEFFFQIKIIGSFNCGLYPGNFYSFFLLSCCIKIKKAEIMLMITAGNARTAVKP